MIHEYKTGRTVCGFAEFLAWLVVIVSVLMILGALGTASKGGGYELALAALLPALIVLIVGIILVVLIQIARAAMDSSVAAQKNVIQTRKHHEEMMRAMRSYSDKSPAVPTRSPALSPESPEQARESSEGAAAKPSIGDLPAAQSLRYNGKTITHSRGQYRVFGIPHASLEAAKAYIDSLDGSSAEQVTARHEPTGRS